MVWGVFLYWKNTRQVSVSQYWCKENLKQKKGYCICVFIVFLFYVTKFFMLKFVPFQLVNSYIGFAKKKKNDCFICDHEFRAGDVFKDH